MCEPIYVIQNITLWSCPTLISCTVQPGSNNNLVINGTLKRNSTLRVNNTLTLEKISNLTFALNTSRNYSNVILNDTLSQNDNTSYIPTLHANRTAYGFNKTLPEEEIPKEEIPKEEIPPGDVVPPEPPMPETTGYLRHGLNKTHANHTSNTTNHCVCDTSTLLWLHMLWALPLLLLILLILFRFSRKKRHKILNIFIPQKKNKITRSSSWPQIVPKKELNIVPASEPGDVSSRGVFLTGIL